MNCTDDPSDLIFRFFLEPAAAWVRSRLPGLGGRPDAEAAAAGLRAKLSLHPWKRTGGLPRVRRVLGILRGIAPEKLLDIGSGRGAFLWPLLDAFPALPVASIDRDRKRAAWLGEVAAGGLRRLSPAAMDVGRLAFGDGTFDAVTVLEVLEHLRRPERAASEVLRVARRFVIASVPSKPDDNPEHIHRFTQPALMALFLNAGAARVDLAGVFDHTIAIVRKGGG